MNRPILLGITGGIGSGKSIVCKILETLRVPVYYADDRAKWLMSNQAPLKASIIELFGQESYTEEGLNRPHIAQLAFNNQSVLSKLNALVHPAVANDFKSWIEQHESEVLAKEAALLFETGSYKELDKNWLVTCPEEIRIARVLSRDSHRSKESIQDIMRKQWSDHQKRSLADMEIVNDGTLPVLKKVMTALKDLKNL